MDLDDGPTPACVAMVRMTSKMKALSANIIFLSIPDDVLFDSETSVFSTAIAVHRQTRLLYAFRAEANFVEVFQLMVCPW
jgi:hypothetical protein